jgi:transaldolase
MTNPIPELTHIGQSIWYDNIQKKLIENGEFDAMIKRGDIRGVTSNPSIYQNAIAKSHDYDPQLRNMAQKGISAEEIFWELAKSDISTACDLFHPLYLESNKIDGYVSLEVHPGLSEDAAATVTQASQLWNSIKKPNLMIKIPATTASLPAIRKTISEGINVNVTLIFSVERYMYVMDAYMSGLEDRLSSGKPIDSVHSVASFFISRIDSKIDPLLPTGSRLAGKIAIANAKLAYAKFLAVIEEPRFQKLKKAGANVQRPLWASTSSKNPAYPDTIYVDNLIGPGTVNTVPPATLDAFKDHGTAKNTLTEGMEVCLEQLGFLSAAGIRLENISEELEKEGVKAFKDAFESLVSTIEQRRRDITNQ